MQKKPNNRLYAIVDASGSSKEELKAVLAPFAPQYREGKTLTIGGVQDVLFVELRKRESPVFEIMKSQAQRWSLYPFYVVEENKGYYPKGDKYGSAYEYFIVDAAIMDVPAPQEGLESWIEKVRAKAKEIYRNDSVFLKFHVYERKENGTLHVLCCNTENTNRHGSGEVVLGEEGWKDAVCKIVTSLAIPVEFRKVRYKNL